jgi:hypothetical protein
LLSYDPHGDNEIALRCLRRHRHGTNGGIATYASPGPIRRSMGLGEEVSIDGWCQAHTEVTAAAGLAFELAGSPWSTDAEAAWGFVAPRQCDDGAWRSYWWADDLYPTAQAVVLAKAGRPTRHRRGTATRAARWAERRQSIDGAWGRDSNGGIPLPFLTALGVIILASAPGFDDRLVAGVEALLRCQEADGGWASGPVLRIPPPHVVEPRKVAGWREEALGTGVVISDRARLYTTATVLSALCLAGR